MSSEKSEDDPRTRPSYERIPEKGSFEITESVDPNEDMSEAARAGGTLANFILLSVLFSSNHGGTVACLSLATARLGNIGAWQSGVLYLTYTASAVLGATYVVKSLGARNAIMAGMGLYCAYIGCFLLTTVSPQMEKPVALLGAVVGGFGGGFLWTAQGSYFGRAAEEHASALQTSVAIATSFFSGIFAFVYLALEVILKLLSTVLVEKFGMPWSVVFGIYTVVAITSTAGMVFVRDYEDFPIEDDDEQRRSVFYEVTAAWNLLVTDPKMKWMIGLNAAFGFAGAFLNSFVNGEVVRISLSDDDSSYVGLLSAFAAAVAAVMSLLFGKLTQRIGNELVLIMGAASFFMVAFLFVAKPGVAGWSWGGLLMVYTFQGIGRSTFEGTLRATFADYFQKEKEAAFANIILQNGLSSALGFFLSINLPCSAATPNTYCIQFKDGTMHDVLAFELIVIISAVFAILGFCRSSLLFQRESQAKTTGVDDTFLPDKNAVLA